MNYKLELKQIVEFPRCRIYRDFIQTLITTKSIRTTGGSFLFIIWYYAPMQITAHPTAGWNTLPIPLVQESGSAQSQIFRNGFAAVSNIKRCPSFRFFEEQNYITYSLLGKNRLVKFKISDWPKDNTVLEYNYPCKKDTGFFFFPDCQSSRTNWHWKMLGNGCYSGSVDSCSLQRFLCPGI